MACWIRLHWVRLREVVLVRKLGLTESAEAGEGKQVDVEGGTLGMGGISDVRQMLEQNALQEEIELSKASLKTGKQKL